MPMHAGGWRGAEAVQRLRALRSSGDFDDYWPSHEAREWQRIPPGSATPTDTCRDCDPLGYGSAKGRLPVVAAYSACGRPFLTHVPSVNKSWTWRLLQRAATRDRMRSMSESPAIWDGRPYAKHTGLRRLSRFIRPAPYFETSLKGGNMRLQVVDEDGKAASSAGYPSNHDPITVSPAHRGASSSPERNPAVRVARYSGIFLAIWALLCCDTGLVPTDGSDVKGGMLILPPGHGLPVGRIEISAGAYEEHGNVLISCPGFSDATRCVIFVLADGTATYSLAEIAPHVTPRAGVYWRDNVTAEDLLDHWNDPRTIAQVLRVSATSRSTERLRTLLSDIDEGRSRYIKTRFRNVRPDTIEVIGERGGIVYGRWMDGPAGTMNVEFDYRSSSFLDSSVRAAIERAGKAWSYRIASPKQSLVFIAYERDGCGGYPACAVRYGSDGELGKIIFTRDVAGMPGNPNIYASDWNDQMGTTVHELGHLLPVPPSHGPYVNKDAGTYDGPTARSENGGVAVPYRRRDSENRDVPIGTPGAVIDYNHLHACVPSVMSYYGYFCADETEGSADGTGSIAPKELDFAILTDLMRYELIDAEKASKPEVYGYGAWGDYSAWGIGVARTLRFAGHHQWRNSPVFQGDLLWATADAFGRSPDKSEIANSTLSGTVVWKGSVLGVDRGRFPPVLGDAELHVDIASLTGTVRIVNLAAVSDNAVFRRQELEFAIRVTGNSIEDLQDHVRGRFYGPGHEEMVVVIDAPTGAGNLLAVFGGKR